MTLWLTRQHDGTYMLTRLRPYIATVEGTTYMDAYMRPGEPIGVRHLCAPGLFALSGFALEPLQSVKITLTLTRKEDEWS